MALRIGITMLLGMALLSGCGDSSGSDDAACGWDLSTPAGQEAMTARLDAVLAFQREHPGQTPPPIDSEYWRGDCSQPSGSAGPPLHELDEPGHETAGTHAT